MTIFYFLGLKYEYRTAQQAFVKISHHKKESKANKPKEKEETKTMQEEEKHFIKNYS